jgi:hypothetical protein
VKIFLIVRRKIIMSERGVYWACRDLDGAPLGGHHFVLIYLAPNMAIPRPARQREGDQEFITLCGNQSPKGDLFFDPNNAADVQSVRESLNPKKQGMFSYSLEEHKVKPPNGGGVWGFAMDLIKRAYLYDERAGRTLVQPHFDLNPGFIKSGNGGNCACWTNALFKAAGVSRAERGHLGEFRGIDWGEEDESLANYFSY